MKSMTGFGRAESRSSSGLNFFTEISSVNRKQLEIRLSMPGELNCFEPAIRKTVASRISRGALSVRINIVYEAEAVCRSMKINELLFEHVAGQCRALQTRHSIDGAVTVGDILRVPGVLETVSPDLSAPNIEKALMESVNSALDAFVSMRRDEGLVLKEDIAGRLALLKDILTRIAPLVKTVPAQVSEKLRKRLEDSELELNIDEERLAREVVFYADRMDVSEELTRLESHLEQFDSFLADADEKPVGRSMDFLIQEIMREITTLSNKAASPELSPLSVQFKTELEKIREQVQNIE